MFVFSTAVQCSSRDWHDSSPTLHRSTFFPFTNGTSFLCCVHIYKLEINRITSAGAKRFFIYLIVSYIFYVVYYFLNFVSFSKHICK